MWAARPAVEGSHASHAGCTLHFRRAEGSNGAAAPGAASRTAPRCHCDAAYRTCLSCAIALLSCPSEGPSVPSSSAATIAAANCSCMTAMLGLRLAEKQGPLFKQLVSMMICPETVPDRCCYKGELLAHLKQGQLHPGVALRGSHQEPPLLPRLQRHGLRRTNAKARDAAAPTGCVCGHHQRFRSAACASDWLVR